MCSNKKSMEEQHSSHIRKNRCLLVSTLTFEERVVVDSGASMRMISKKDVSEAEMDMLTKLCRPTMVITFNEGVQKHEEAILYVLELEILLTMKVFENTPAVLSFGKLCDENMFLRKDQWSKKHILLRTEFGLFATRKTSFLLFQTCQVLPLDLHQFQGHLCNRRVILLLHLLHPQ